MTTRARNSAAARDTSGTTCVQVSAVTVARRRQHPGTRNHGGPGRVLFVVTPPHPPADRSHAVALLAVAAVGLASCSIGSDPAARADRTGGALPGFEALASEHLRDTGPPAVPLSNAHAGPRERTPSALRALVDGLPEADALPAPLVDLAEVADGGQPPDGIPALDAPRFQRTGDVHWIDGSEQVLVVEVDGEARAYPVQVLTLHEIVNDTIAGVPAAVTYCPLCASGVAFDRRVGDRVLSFGTSGRLYRSDLLMYDRQTESLWPQIAGQAVAGVLTGAELRVLPASLISWDQWKAAHPGGWVLSRQTGFAAPYGSNPYSGYDDKASLPEFLAGPIDNRIEWLKQPVVGIASGDDALAVDIEALRIDGVRTVEVGGREMTVWWLPGARSSLDGSAVGEGREVGTIGVFDPDVGGRRLTFRPRDGAVVDDQTGSTWNALGGAVSGPLAGRQLRRVPHTTTFWFAWSGFHEDTRVER